MADHGCAESDERDFTDRLGWQVDYSMSNLIEINFFDRQNSSSPTATKKVSFSTDKDGRAATNILVTAYDLKGNITTPSLVPDTGGAVVTVESSLPNIHKVTSTGAAGNQDGISLDDVSFKPFVPAG